MLLLLLVSSYCYDSSLETIDDLSYANFSITGESNNLTWEQMKLNFMKKLDFNINDFTIKNLNNENGGGFKYSGTEIYINLQNASFFNCSSNQGGSLFFQGYKQLSVDNCLFLNSSSSSYGGSKYVTSIDTVLFSNTQYISSKSGSYGGAMYISSSTSILSNCSFLHNFASGVGGSLYISSPKMEINNCSFTNCTSLSDGGTAYLSSSTLISINNSIFNTSKGRTGGTLWITSSRSVLNGSRFSKSNSSLEGGTAYISSSINSSISNCDFMDSRGSSGGTLWILSPSIDMKNNTFVNSSSISAGGSHYLSCSYCKYNQIWFKNTSSGTTGGATHIESSTNGGLFHFSDCFFGECRSSTNGGAIYINFRLNDITEVYSCTFYSCISGQEGGAVCFVNSNRGSFVCDLKRICISECSTSSTTTSNRGSTFLIDSYAENHLISLSMVTASSCGTLGKGTGTFYINFGQQKGDGLNISYCSSFLGSGSYFSPYFAAIYEFNNFVNCTSSSSYCIYCQLAQPSSYSFEITRSNFLNNEGLMNIFYVVCGTSFKWLLRYSILYSNKGTLFYSTTNHQVQYCYIVHSGTYSNGYIQNTLCFTTTSTSVLTPTYALSHYSTYLCAIPNDQEPLEVPCQTIPEELIPPECPPIPSTCNIPSDGSSLYFGLASTFFHILTTSIVNLI